MKKMQLEPRASINFKCACGHAFESEPGRIEDAPDRPWHPYRYFAKCHDCGQEAKQVQWEAALLKAYTRRSGPKTKEGIAAVTRNLKGHPTPEETKITRFNALKHGMRSQVATFFPARPGRYAQCETCDLIDTCKSNPACLKKVELYMKHHVAFETGDPSMLAGMRATLQSNIQAVIDDMFLAIIQDGVRLKTPKWYYDKEGIFHWAASEDPETGKLIKLYDVTAHPLIKLVGELVSKNGMTLNDSSMTPRQAGDKDTAEKNDNDVSAEELRAWKKQSDRQSEQLRAMIQRSQKIIDVTPSTPGENDG